MWIADCRHSHPRTQIMIHFIKTFKTFAQKRRIHKCEMICSSFCVKREIHSTTHMLAEKKTSKFRICISIIITFWNLTHQSCGKNGASSSPTWLFFTVSLKILEIYFEGNAKRNKEEINWKKSNEMMIQSHTFTIMECKVFLSLFYFTYGFCFFHLF